jgi:hypothetical protein
LHVHLRGPAPGGSRPSTAAEPWKGRPADRHELLVAHGFCPVISAHGAGDVSAPLRATWDRHAVAAPGSGGKAQSMGSPEAASVSSPPVPPWLCNRCTESPGGGRAAARRWRPDRQRFSSLRGQPTGGVADQRGGQGAGVEVASTRRRSGSRISSIMGACP